MEYEIEEDLLLDRSTNPSLLHQRRRNRAKPRSTFTWSHSREATKGQKALVIPEEEEQLS